MSRQVLNIIGEIEGVFSYMDEIGFVERWLSARCSERIQVTVSVQVWIRISGFVFVQVSASASEVT